MVLITKSTLLLSLLIVAVSVSISSCQLISKKIKKEVPIQSTDSSSKLIEEIPIASITQQSNVFQGSSNNSFSIVNEIAQQEVNNWLNRKSQVPNFTASRPDKPKLLASSLLKKDEFETTQDFQERVLNKEQERLEKINILEKKYQEDIDSYNNQIRFYNNSIVDEKNRRAANTEIKYWEFVNKNLVTVLGNPTIDFYQYNADEQAFYAVLGSVKSNLKQWIKVYVPSDKAKIIKQNAKGATPILSFEKNSNEQLIIASISVEVGTSKYSATLINKPVFNNPEHIVRSKEINVPENYLSIN